MAKVRLSALKCLSILVLIVCTETLGKKFKNKTKKETRDKRESARERRKKGRRVARWSTTDYA